MDWGNVIGERKSLEPSLKERLDSIEKRLSFLESNTRWTVETDAKDYKYGCEGIRYDEIPLKRIVEFIVQHLGIHIKKETEKIIPCKLILKQEGGEK